MAIRYYSLKSSLFHILLLCTTAFVLSIVNSIPIYAQTPLKNQQDQIEVVLVLSFAVDRPAHFVGIPSFSRTLRSNIDKSVTYHIESLVSEVFDSNVQQERLIDLLKERYANRNIDLVVYVDEPALEFGIDFGSEIFGQSPSMFYQVDIDYLSAMPTAPAMPGTTMDIDIKGSLRTILEVHPDTRHVLVVSGTTPIVRYFAEQVREFAVSAGDEVEFEFSENMPFDSLLKRASTLPDHSVVFHIFIGVDITGEIFHSSDALIPLVNVSIAPIYGIFDFHLGKGIVGGLVNDFDELGRQAAMMATHILNGEIAPDSALYQHVASVYIYDWRELERWKIDKDKLPAESIIRYREPTLWEEHKGKILAIIAALVVQTILVIVLVVNIKNRRNALHRLREAELKYRTVADFAYDWEWWENPDGDMIYVSPAFERITGYPVKMLIENPSFLMEIIHEEDIKKWQAHRELIMTRRSPAGVYNQDSNKGW